MARHSQHATIVEYGVREMMKGKSPATAAKATVKKLHAEGDAANRETRKMIVKMPDGIIRKNCGTLALAMVYFGDPTMTVTSGASFDSSWERA